MRNLKLILMIGCPGSGKSFEASRISADTGAVIVSTDAIRGELFGDENCQDNPGAVFSLAYSRTAKLLSEGTKNVIFDATNLHRKDRRRVIEEVENRMNALGYNPNDKVSVSYEAVLVQTDLSTCLRRNSARSRHVPEEVVERMYNASEMVTPEGLLAEGFNVRVVKSRDDYDMEAYNDGFRDAENTFDKMLVNPKYKGIVMAALKEAYEHELLGSIGDRDACSLYHRLKYEDYCKERGKSYDELTEDDFEQIALREINEEEREL